MKAGLLDNLKFKFVLSPMTYARLLMAELVTWDRFIYLDTDLIVRHDLREMYDVDLGEVPLAGVFHSENLNAGVLLINGRVWRRDGLMRKTLDFARIHTPKDADQGAIEGVLKGHMARLDPRWNVIIDPVWGKARLADETALHEAWIVHFITGFKPWNLGRWLLPKPYLALWDANRVRTRLPRVLSAEIKKHCLAAPHLSRACTGANMRHSVSRAKHDPARTKAESGLLVTRFCIKSTFRTRCAPRLVAACRTEARDGSAAGSSITEATQILW